MSTTDRTPTTRRPTAERLPIDEQFWPVNLLLLVLGAVVSGAIAVRADFFTPRLLGSGWTWLATVWLIVGLVTLGAWRLGDRAARRLQLSAVLAILLILFLLTYFGDREVLWLDLAQ
ncbi:MAG: hypothetical protein K8T91_06300, partial [Planctomycetes bacterium]|nr:hypothetical protein [Planctomycetota bacterium]